jgi:hypothetical protein
MSDEPEMNGAGRRGGREIVLFFLRLLVVSIVLYVPYDRYIAEYYSRLIAVIAKPLLAVFGYEMIMEKALRITEDIALNPFVFLSLVIAAGRIHWRTKLRAALIGAAILTAANSLTVFLAFMSEYRNSERMWAETEFLSLTMNFFVPLLLWLVLLPIRSVFPFFRSNE